MRDEGGDGERAGRSHAGLAWSGGAHAVLLACLLLHFAAPAPDLAVPPETVQVDLVPSDANEITNGEKNAKVLPTPQRRADKVAELEDHHALPPTPQAAKDTATPDAPDKANDDPGHADKPAEPVAAMPPPRPVETPPVPPTRPAEAAPMPPARPVEAKSEPAKSVPAKSEPAKSEAKEDDKPDAEAVAPKPPPRPRPPKEAKEAKEAKDEPKPLPRPRPVKVAKVVPPKKPDPKPEPRPETPPPVVPPPPEKPSLLDQVASLLKKAPEPPKPKPRTGDEVKDARPHDDFNPEKISALIDHDAAQRRASSGRVLAKAASLGLASAHAEKLSPSMAAQIDNWLIDHYRGCWSYFGLGGTQDYVPQLRISMAQDGALIGQPSLLNPPRDPNLKSLAESAIRAVNKCNPMEIPARFRPYYDQGYRERVVRFDPKEMS